MENEKRILQRYAARIKQVERLRIEINLNQLKSNIDIIEMLDKLIRINSELLGDYVFYKTNITKVNKLKVRLIQQDHKAEQEKI